MLHFELCYYQLIERAIARGYTLFEAGAQGEHKLKRGLAPVHPQRALDPPSQAGRGDRFRSWCARQRESRPGARNTPPLAVPRERRRARARMIEVFYFFSFRWWRSAWRTCRRTCGRSASRAADLGRALGAAALVAGGAANLGLDADRTRHHARVLRLIGSGACLGFPRAARIGVRRFSTILSDYFGYALFYIGLGGMTDSLAISRMQAGAVYGRLRLWGSVGSS